MDNNPSYENDRLIKRDMEGKAEREFKRIIDQDKELRTVLTNQRIEDSYTIGGFIAGDAHVFYKPRLKLIAL